VVLSLGKTVDFFPVKCTAYKYGTHEMDLKTDRLLNRNVAVRSYVNNTHIRAITIHCVPSKNARKDHSEVI